MHLLLVEGRGGVLFVVEGQHLGGTDLQKSVVADCQKSVVVDLWKSSNMGSQKFGFRRGELEL